MKNMITWLIYIKNYHQTIKSCLNNQTIKNSFNYQTIKSCLNNQTIKNCFNNHTIKSCLNNQIILIILPLDTIWEKQLSS
jgi:hypothetical protein